MPKVLCQIQPEMPSTAHYIICCTKPPLPCTRADGQEGGRLKEAGEREVEI